MPKLYALGLSLLIDPLPNFINPSERQSYYLGWTIAGGLLVILGILTVSYIRLQMNCRKAQQQVDQSSVLVKEVHHRAKNNLAIVSSLLFLQTTRLHDEDTIGEIRAMQQRVEAMALIHQRLYQTDETTRVNMRDYLTDLAEGLLKAYGYRPGDVNLQITVGLTNLDVDIAIPVGLIVNELITNACKYAYALVSRPMLCISLCPVSEPEQSGIRLEVQDNGPGIAVDDWERTKLSKAFGKHLIQLLTRQLDGQFDISNHRGARFGLFIPQTRLHA